MLIHAMFMIEQSGKLLGFLNSPLAIVLSLQMFCHVLFYSNTDFDPMAEMPNHAPHMFQFRASSKSPPLRFTAVVRVWDQGRVLLSSTKAIIQSP